MEIHKEGISEFLAQLLGQFNIHPKQVRAGPSLESRKGYERADFLDAWSRYLPEEAKQGKQEEQVDPPSSHPTGETRETEETEIPEWARGWPVRQSNDNRRQASNDDGHWVGHGPNKIKITY